MTIIVILTVFYLGSFFVKTNRIDLQNSAHQEIKTDEKSSDIQSYSAVSEHTKESDGKKCSFPRHQNENLETAFRGRSKKPPNSVANVNELNQTLTIISGNVNENELKLIFNNLGIDFPPGASIAYLEGVNRLMLTNTITEHKKILNLINYFKGQEELKFTYSEKHQDVEGKIIELHTRFYKVDSIVMSVLIKEVKSIK